MLDEHEGTFTMSCERRAAPAQTSIWYQVLALSVKSLLWRLSDAIFRSAHHLFVKYDTRPLFAVIAV